VIDHDEGLEAMALVAEVDHAHGRGAYARRDLRRRRGVSEGGVPGAGGRP
jgi:hypothetical protein